MARSMSEAEWSPHPDASPDAVSFPFLAAQRIVQVGTRSSLGETVSRRLIGYGASLVGIDHVARDADDIGLVEHVVADMADSRAAEDAVAHAVASLGGVDAFVFGAAVQRGGAVWETGDEDWDAVQRGTLQTLRNTLRFGVPALGEAGSVVVISSVNATVAHPRLASYAAAKGATDALVRQVALDAAPRGIRINAVSPAYVDGGPEIADYGYPMNRTPSAVHVADAVMFLLSSLAGGITGVVLPVDAGLSITSAAAVSRPQMRRALFGEGANETES